MRSNAPILAGLLSLAAKTGRADPTWPSPIDQMEEIVYQLQGVGGSLFNDIINPCQNEAAGPGRLTAAEWLRTGFHDAVTHNRFSLGGATGGLDGSLQYELSTGDNIGPGFTTTLQFYSHYFTARSSIADLIAAGVYASVRQCGGPVVPLRFGRKDATGAGPSGFTPQPQNSAVSFRNQFDRMGFDQTSMIQLVACGHTLGSVHSSEFPTLVPQSVGQIGLDSSNARFDNRIAVEYVNNNSTNPLIVSPRSQNRHSDFKVFNLHNATVTALLDPAAFQTACRSVLQRMIDVVPATVTLSSPIAPYEVKPQNMKLTLTSGGCSLLMTGNIRVRVTERPASAITNLVLTWKDRTGVECGSSACSVTVTQQGMATGFDDTFAIFPIEATIPVTSGISSFTITINRNDGPSESYDNNGNSYPLSDAVIIQRPQSCLLQTTGALTLTALVRNDVDLAGLPVELSIDYLVPRTTGSNPVPELSNANVVMTQGETVGQYTWYTASYTIPGGQSYNARLSVTAGPEVSPFKDDFFKGSLLGGTCQEFGTPSTCSPSSSSSSAVPSSTSSAISSSSSEVVSSSSSEVVSSSSTSEVVSSSSTPASSVVSSTSSSVSSSSSASPSPTGPARKTTVGGYVLLNCWTEGTGVRALSGAAFANDEMTLELCASNCAGFDYFGAEYGRECYCGNSLHSSSSEVPAEECNMACSGDPTEYCGAGNRLELYSTTATRTSSSTPAPTATLARKPTVGDYTLVGCQTEGTAGRALADKADAHDDMTLESCATFCAGYTYFGTEYGRECYCGNTIGTGSVEAEAEECSMPCAGNPFEYCGAGNRLELYRLTSAPSTTASSSVSATPTPTGTLQRTLAIGAFDFVGCWTEGAGARAIEAKSYASGEMTLDSCAAFCDGYKYFGTEYSSECFCGNELHPTSTEATLADCSMTCSGDPFQYCGGPSRLELYESREFGAPTTASHPDTVGDWTFHGCVTEATATRALGAKITVAADMTLDDCAAFCDGHQYFGTEYGSECYCGDEFGLGSVEAPETDCNMVCSGDSLQFCGAGNRLSVYSIEEV